MISWKKYIVSSLFIIGIYVFGYCIERKDFWQLFGLYSIVFFLFLYLIKIEKKQNFLLLTGLFARLILLFSIPNLSQDFYRFIWDGRMIYETYNPYLYLPNDLMQDPSFDLSQKQELFDGMGDLSAGHFSNYPPINQFIFWLAAVVSNHSIFGSIIFIKIIIILSDLMIFSFGKKILDYLNRNPNWIFLYFLNPFIILELTGNLHFEGTMLCFFVLSLYLLIKNQWKTSAIAIGISISVKLLPLILLPLFFQSLGWKKSIIFYTITIGLNLLLFVPFLSFDLLEKYGETIGLWFVNFEFNASIYYILREIGYNITGYNEIHRIGKILPVIMVFSIGIISFLKKNKTFPQLILSMLLVLSIYFFQSTTVHPWYIVNLLVLGVLTNKIYPLIWSFLVFLSYSAYDSNGFQENITLIFIQYFIVISVFLIEFFPKNQFSQNLLQRISIHRIINL